MIIGVFFKEWDSLAEWTNWTPYLNNNVKISQRLESENSGEAGLISIDNVDLEFRMELINGQLSPVASTLNEATLNQKNRLMFLIRAYPNSGGSYTNLFEGMADLSTIKYPYVKDDNGELIKLVTFSVVDKLTAMSNLTPLGLRRDLKDAVKQVNNLTEITGNGSGSIAGSIGSNVIIGNGTGFTTELSEEGIYSSAGIITVNGIGINNSDVDFIVKKIHSDTKVELWVNLDISFYNNGWKFKKYTSAQGLYRPKYIKLSDNEFRIDFYRCLASGLPDYTDRKVLASNPLEVGDIIAYNREGTALAYNDLYYESEGLAEKTVENEFDLFLVKTTGLLQTGDFNGSIYVKTVNSTEKPDDSLVLYTSTGGVLTSIFMYSVLFYYDKIYYNNTYLITEMSEAIAYDGLSLISALINSIWNGTTIYHPDFTNYEIPLEYFTRLVDYLPFDAHPFEAIKYLVNNMNCYLWYEPDNNNLVLKKWVNFSSATPSFNLDSYNIYYQDGEKKYFWDKLSDAAEIYVSSYLPERDKETNKWTGKFIDGGGFAYKNILGKPKNVVSKRVIVDNLTLASYGITVDINGEYWDNANKLNKYADLKAAEYLDFYGKRHYSFNVTYVLDYVLVESGLKIGSVITFKGDKYFINSLEVDYDSPAIQFELVSVTAYDYDISTVLIEKYDSASNLSSNSSSLTGHPLGYGDSSGGTSYGSIGIGSESITTLGTITTGVWHASPIEANYILYNPLNLKDDSVSYNITYIESSSGLTAITLSIEHEIEVGDTIYINDCSLIVSGYYQVTDIPDINKIQINYSTNSGSSSGTVSTAHKLNTIQDIHVLAEPEFYGLKISANDTLQNEEYIQRDYVVDIERVNTEEVNQKNYGYFRLFATDEETYTYGTFDLILKDNDLIAPYPDISLVMNPEYGFSISQGEAIKFIINEYSLQFYRQINLDTTPIISNIFKIDSENAVVSFSSYSNDANGGSFILEHKRVNQNLSDYLNLDDEIGALIFRGYNEVNPNYSFASIKAYASKLHTSGDTPTYLAFYTTPNESDVELSRLIIDSEGKLGFGVSNTEITKEMTWNNSYSTGSLDFISGWMSGIGWQLEAESFSGIEKIIISGSSAGNGIYVIECNDSHLMSKGDRVIISGMSGAKSVLNGGYIVQSVTSDSFTILNNYTGSFNTPEGKATPVSYEYNLVLDNLEVRGTMSVWELLVQQIRVTNGNLLVTAGARADSEMFSTDLSGYEVGWFYVEDITEHGVAPFSSDDIIMCQQVNLGSLSQSDFETGDWITIKLESKSLVKRLLYRVSRVVGLKVYVSLSNSVGSSMGFPANKGIVERGNSFARIGNVLDTNRQGMVGIFADEREAPYIRIIDNVDSWAAWKDRDSTKVQIGKLDGITDIDFGGIAENPYALTGYGAYLKDNIFMKGTLVVKSSAQLNPVDNSIMIGNIDISDGGYSGIYITNNIYDSTGSTSGIYGYDADGELNFRLGLDNANSPLVMAGELVHFIAGWGFNKEKFAKGNVSLQATYDYALGTGIDGLSAYSEFQSSLYNSINIGDFANLEASYYPNIDYSNLIQGRDFNSENDLNYWVFGDINDSNVYPKKYYVRHSLDEDDENQDIVLKIYGGKRMTGKDGIPINHHKTFFQIINNVASIKGKKVELSFRYKHPLAVTGYTSQSESNPPGKRSIIVSVEVNSDVLDQNGDYAPVLLKKFYYNSNKEDSFNIWYEAKAIIDLPSNLEYMKIWFQIEYITDLQGDISILNSNIADFYIDRIRLHYYPKVITNINSDGFLVKNSPSRYIKFSENGLEISASNLKIGDANVSRWLSHSSVTSGINSNSGDLVVDTNTNVLMINTGGQLTPLTTLPISFKKEGASYSYVEYSDVDVHDSETDDGLTPQKGFQVNVESDGEVIIATDRMKVRKTLVVEETIQQNTRAFNGNVIFSNAGKVKIVQALETTT